MMSTLTGTEREPIAIIGIGCRFPGGANTPEAYWDLLRDGVDAIVEIPPERWHRDAFHDPDAFDRGKMVSRWGGFIEGIDAFDASFFGISRQEAARMDPQQRLLLEVGWEAFEDAGLRQDTLAGSETGVYIGVTHFDYRQIQLSSHDRELISAYTAPGVQANLLANRLSYFFDLRGPSVPVDTACSSSLVAVHLACSSIWSGDCSLALAGGVNAILIPEASIMLSEATLLSPDGRCQSFAAAANGYVRSEGCGLVVLKPLAQALADGDSIYSVIRASAVNQDGHKDSLVSPSQSSLETLLKRTYQRAHISPRDIQYIEAQATGTQVGDQIEAMALGQVMSQERGDDEACWVGSMKTNMGHLESAAGIAALIKATLVLKHRRIPPHLHCQVPNPAIDWDRLKLRIPQKLESWPESKPHLAAVNALG